MFGIRTTRLFPTRSQRPWLRGRRRVSFADLARAAEAGDADAIEGLLSLVLSGEEGESEFSERAMASLAELLEEEAGAKAEIQGHAGGTEGSPVDPVPLRPAPATESRAAPLTSRPGVARGLAKLEVQAQCFELVEKDAGLTQRMPALLLRAAGRHAEDRGYHVTGERITQALAARRAP